MKEPNSRKGAPVGPWSKQDEPAGMSSDRSTRAIWKGKDDSAKDGDVKRPRNQDRNGEKSKKRRKGGG